MPRLGAHLCLSGFFTSWILLSSLGFPNILVAQEWVNADVPGDWKQAPPENRSTYRCWAKVPTQWQDRRIDIFVECGDEAREVLINGHTVAHMGSFPPDYRSGLGQNGRFEIDHELIQFGAPNLIEIRLYRRRGRTNLNIAAPAIFAEQFAIHLKGTWQKQLGEHPSDEAVEAHANFTFANIEPGSDVTARLRRLEGDLGPLAPAEALKRLKPHDGFRVEQVLSDPIIGQPLSIKWDHRGRLWLAEYLQYPDPAGLKKISRDPFLRTVYDRVPPAPPNHFKGKDRISIHEDTDGDGTYDKHSVFVDELNLMTSFALGYGGVFVLNPPYLLFYADADGDDTPDGDPEVLLEGFGLEDSHSIANSLRLGPDGWLYGAQGSTVSGAIKEPGSEAEPIRSVGQLIWRYHPELRKYEVFAEGGGNAFGVEIDARGHIYSGHNGGDTRGFHYVQGGYYQKGFSKHGALSNPYAFGYFPWMKHHSVPRFTHTFVIDEGGLLEPPYAGRLYGVEPLQGRVVMSKISNDGSTYRTEDLGYALTSQDSWFRPVDIQIGPDGALYVADFYEQKIDHASHYQGRVSPESGRVYRLAPTHARVVTKTLGDTPSAWASDLTSSNKWIRHEAIRLIRDHQPKEIVQELHHLLKQDHPRALEGLWGLHAMKSMREANWIAAIQHPRPEVRRWAIRLCCDTQPPSPLILTSLMDQALIEPDVQVRSQMASTARRLAPQDNLELVNRLARRNSDTEDPHLPLLLWWSIESVAQSHPAAIVDLVRQSEFSSSSLVQKHLLPRIMRRFAVTGRSEGLEVCSGLLAAAPTQESVQRLLVGFDEAIAGRPLTNLPNSLVNELAKHRGDSLELRLLLKQDAAYQLATEQILDSQVTEANRLKLMEILSSHRRPSDVDLWLQMVSRDAPAKLRIAALTALMPSEEPTVADTILRQWPKFNLDEKQAAQTLLASRPSWSTQLLSAIETQSISAHTIDPQTIRRIQYHREPALQAKIETLWPSLANQESRIDTQVIEDWSEKLVSGLGNPYDGRGLFGEKCGKCHRLFGQGGDLGPDLTSYQRTDLSRFLANILDPSLEIREGYQTTVIETEDGLIVSGFIESEDDVQVSIRQIDGQLARVPKELIVDQFMAKISLMPKGLLDDLDEQQARDLFAYLRSSQPLP
jgi:putative membrane-bound dehydrogenase-like protein